MAGRSEFQRRIRALGEDLRRQTAQAVRGARLDASASRAAVARAAAISASHFSEIESGQAAPSLDALVSIAGALGKRVSLQLLPDQDPIVTDHRQAPMVEELLRRLDRRWTAALEVPVYRPVHGVIDLVLTDRSSHVVVCVEVQSQIRRLEQQIRWGGQKADALLASGPMLGMREATPRVFRVLALASTANNRAVVNEFPETIRTAFPTAAEEVVSALTTDRSWPGSGIVWLTVHGRVARLLPGSPRGMRRGGRHEPEPSTGSNHL